MISASDGAQLDPVTQEQLDAYELGAETQWFDRALTLNGAVFFYEYKDKQLLTRVVDPLFGPLPILDNAPDSEVRGVELDAQFSPIATLYFALAAAYIETEVLEFDSIDEAGNRRSFAGNEFNFTPKLTYNALRPVSAPTTLTSMKPTPCSATTRCSRTTIISISTCAPASVAATRHGR